jgi:hypothetical protein
MAYSWPDGWNDTRTEQAVQAWVCDRLNVPKKSVRVSIDSESGPQFVSLDIFEPLTAKPTAAVHDVLGRVSQFATGRDVLHVGLPKEKTGDRTYRLKYLFVQHLS